MTMPGATVIYKLTTRGDWALAQQTGTYTGSADDARDGYIHFSAGHQLAGTARKYFRNVADLLLVTVPVAALGAALRWEASRGGDLFPHLYGVLPVAAATTVTPLALDSDGCPILPVGVP
jgi:uncharacterized protein (DUF952 family)